MPTRPSPVSRPARAAGSSGDWWAIAGVVVWAVVAGLHGFDVVGVLTAAFALFIAWLVVARRRGRALPASLAGPTSSSAGLVVLGLAISQLGLEARSHGLPEPLRAVVFVIAMALLFTAVVTSPRRARGDER